MELDLTKDASQSRELVRAEALKTRRKTGTFLIGADLRDQLIDVEIERTRQGIQGMKAGDSLGARD